MPNAVNTPPFLTNKNLLTIRAKSSFKKIVRKINHNKTADAVLVEKASPRQMTAILLSRLYGKKFLWVQNFSNPPIPSFYTRLLLNQADIILASSKKMAAKLHSFGVDKPKIRIKK